MKDDAKVCPVLALSDPDTYASGHPLSRYAELRQACPVAWQADAGGYVAITGLAELQEVSRDPASYSSASGNKIKDDSYERLGADVDAAMRAQMLATDPPLHTALRGALAPFFSPQAIRDREPGVRRQARELLDRLPTGQRLDIVRAATAPFPIRVLCDLLEVPESDRERVFDWTQRLTGADDPEINATPAMAAKAFREVFDYGRELFAERRRHPGKDILSAFATLRIDGEPVTDRQSDALFVLLVAAGNETTRNAITGTLLQLGRDPVQRAALRADPALVRNAVEEGLRTVSPVIHMRRTAVGTRQLAGTRVDAGQKLGLFYGAANHDPRVFAEPERFDLRRSNARNHVAFGFGPHNCLGAPLARLELRVFIEEFLARFPDYTVDSEPVYLRSDFVMGIKRLDLTLR